MFKEGMDPEKFLCGPRVYCFEYYEALNFNIVKEFHVKV